MADFFNTSIDYLVGYPDIPHKVEPVSETMLNEKEQHLLSRYRSLPENKKSIVDLVTNSYIDSI